MTRVPLLLLGWTIGFLVVLVIIISTASTIAAASSQVRLIELHVVAEGRVEDPRSIIFFLFILRIHPVEDIIKFVATSWGGERGDWPAWLRCTRCSRLRQRG